MQINVLLKYKKNTIFRKFILISNGKRKLNLFSILKEHQSRKAQYSIKQFISFPTVCSLFEKHVPFKIYLTITNSTRLEDFFQKMTKFFVIKCFVPRGKVFVS